MIEETYDDDTLFFDWVRSGFYDGSVFIGLEFVAVRSLLGVFVGDLMWQVLSWQQVFAGGSGLICRSTAVSQYCCYEIWIPWIGT